ncbi:MAG: hypothetical protein CFE28_14175 [Alphaproteobacteria bacterium PA2]|nr:MAG: hypothetical protein CFE28_14175 [Alphaproteobacteria bacterium PA2]
MFYFADLGDQRGRSITFGPAIFLEATDPIAKLNWSSSLDPDDQAELNRLKEDGHIIEKVGRRHVFQMTLASVRATQLYSTLLHEIGHWVDWLERVERPRDQGEDYDALYDAFFNRPKAEREAFAHRYADLARERLKQSGVIPFEPLSLIFSPKAPR